MARDSAPSGNPGAAAAASTQAEPPPTGSRVGGPVTPSAMPPRGEVRVLLRLARTQRLMEVVAARSRPSGVGLARLEGPDEWLESMSPSRSAQPATRRSLTFSAYVARAGDFVATAVPSGVTSCSASKRRSKAARRTPFPDDLQSAAGVDRGPLRHGRGVQGAGRSEPAPDARPPERAQRPEPLASSAPGSTWLASR